jgi:hypothetical protein
MDAVAVLRRNVAQMAADVADAVAVVPVRRSCCGLTRAGTRCGAGEVWRYILWLLL